MLCHGAAFELRQSMKSTSCPKERARFDAGGVGVGIAKLGRRSKFVFCQMFSFEVATRFANPCQLPPNGRSRSLPRAPCNQRQSLVVAFVSSH